MTSQDSRINRWRSLAVAALATLVVATAFLVNAATRSGATAAHDAARAAREKSRGLAPAASAYIAAEGRVGTYPGDEVVVGTDFAGTVRRVLVKEKDAVQRGELLVELDADVERAARRETEARVAEAEADLRLFELEVIRAESLVASKVGTPQAVDKALRDRDAAVARRATARAELDRLSVQIARARITAPIDGVVLARRVEVGEAILRGAPVIHLANLSRLRVEAEVHEADSGRIALGAPVVIRAEGDSERTWKGVVEEIPDSVTGRRLKPQDPARPSDTRVLLVKIALPEPSGLKLGRRVEVEIGVAGPS